MFDEAKAFLEDHMQAFGVNPLPMIVEGPGNGIAFMIEAVGPAVTIGSELLINEVPLADWMVICGQALLHQNGSGVAVLFYGPENEASESAAQVVDDLHYFADLAAIHQCYLYNPVEAYCMYDDAIERHDEASLHPIAVALGLSHPRGLESMGFERHLHRDIFEEAEFFKPVITQKRPDLSLLLSLMNAWQKQRGSDIRVRLEAGEVCFSQVS